MEATGLFYYSNTYLRIDNLSLKWFRRVFNQDSGKYGKRQVQLGSLHLPGFYQVSWNIPSSIPNKDYGNFPDGWAVESVCFLPLMLEYSQPHEAGSWEQVPQIWIAQLVLNLFLEPQLLELKGKRSK